MPTRTVFYGKPATAIADCDFKGRRHVRAYWMSVNIRLDLDIGDLVAPELGWQEWAELAEQTRTELKALAEEAERRYVEPWCGRSLKRTPGPTSLPRSCPGDRCHTICMTALYLCSPIARRLCAVNAQDCLDRYPA